VTREDELVQMVRKLLISKKMDERKAVAVILTLKQGIQIIIVYAESDKLN
jgi:hypothetical protein